MFRLVMRILQTIAILVVVGFIFTSCIEENAKKNAEFEPLEEPQTGTILYSNADNTDSEISISASDDSACVVKLKTVDGEDCMSFYVRAGDDVSVPVPAKELYVYFAFGNSWYGNDYLFGGETSYSKDSSICDFSEYTWEYTLSPVTNGNFRETPVDAEEFK